MHALLLLYRLHAKALVRRLGRSLRGAKGILLFVFGAAVIVLWLAPAAWQGMRMRRTDPLLVREMVPVLLLAASMLQAFSSAGERAIAFTPAEVDFLFPGPFTRRQLLAYRIGKSIGGLAFSATILSVVLLRHAAGWPQAWVTMFLAMMFVQLLGMAVTLVGQSVGERAYTRGRKVVLAVVLIAVVVAVLPAVKEARPGFVEVARALRESRVGAIALAPLEVFGRLFTADQWWPTGLANAGLAVALNVALLWVVFHLDADYLETAATKSAAVYERAQRLRRGGVITATPAGKARGAVPQLPYWGGAGPIAWRQSTAAIRNARGLLMVVLLLAVGVAPALLAAREQQGERVAGIAVSAMAWITLIVGGWLRFDFRGDLDQLDYLKSLPVAPPAMAAGQLATPTALMTLCHLLIVTSVCAAMRRADPLLLLAMALSLPFNAVLFAVENLVFLLFPTRAAANPADVQGYGRQVLLLFVKGILVLVAGGLAAACAMIVYDLTDSRAAAGATGAVALAAIAAAMVPLVGWAYHRFDVSADLPA